MSDQERADVADITSFLSSFEGAATLFGMGGSGVAVRTIEGFVLANGRAWTPAARPRGIRKMTPKQCYRNSMRVLADRDDLRYCEGYALSAGGILPAMHGWLVDEHDRVVDPTWEDCGSAAYYGLVIPDTTLATMVLLAQATGFLASDYAVGHPCRKLGRLPTSTEIRQFAREQWKEYKKLVDDNS